MHLIVWECNAVLCLLESQYHGGENILLVCALYGVMASVFIA